MANFYSMLDMDFIIESLPTLKFNELSKKYAKSKYFLFEKRFY